MNITTKKINEIIENKNNSFRDECPFPINVIPSVMGIDLCHVDSISWIRQDNDKLKSLIISFNSTCDEKTTQQA